jgi:hypothetical protein
VTVSETGSSRVKRGLAEMLKGGVIMDVVTPEQARIAEDAGAVAVMALERVPADIRSQGGVARMSDPDLIDAIIAEVSIPVMAKARIGHFVEAQVLQALDVDYIDESEVLSPADYVNHNDKWAFNTPFVCGATNLGEAALHAARTRFGYGHRGILSDVRGTLSRIEQTKQNYCPRPKDSMVADTTKGGSTSSRSSTSRVARRRRSPTACARSSSAARFAPATHSPRSAPWPSILA